MTTPRDKALENLKKMIEEQRARIDPKLLDLVRAAIRGEKDGSVPYDRAAATKAIEIFLKAHGNAKEFQQKLFELIKKSQH